MSNGTLASGADDGIGIDASVLSQEGRPGHFGLRYARTLQEYRRTLEVWSEHGAGTEMELTIPAHDRLRGSRLPAPAAV